MQAAQTSLTLERAARDERLLKLRFTHETISIPASGSPGDDVGLDETSTDQLDFLRIQLTRALSIQYSVLIIHCIAPFLGFGSIEAHVCKTILAGRRGKAAR